MQDGVFIIGAGGHASVIADIILLANPSQPMCFIDQFSDRTSFLGFSVFNTLQKAQDHHPNYSSAIIAIGHNETRQGWIHKIQMTTQLKLPIIVHPKAIVSQFSQIAPGCVIAAGAMVGPGCSLGVGCIANSGSIVEHDAQVGSFVHLGPGSITEAHACVPDLTWVKSGQIIKKESPHA